MSKRKEYKSLAEALEAYTDLLESVKTKEDYLGTCNIIAKVRNELKENNKELNKENK